MRIQSKFLEATMFAAVLLGASFTTENVKADDVTDSNDKNQVSSPVKDTRVYNGFSAENNSKTQDSSNQTQANQATATSDVSSDKSNSVDNSTNQFKPQNDYYNYVNDQWLTNTDVLKTKQDASTIADVQNGFNAQVQSKFMNYVNGKEKTTDPNMLKAINFYRLLLNQNYTTTTDFSNDAIKTLMAEVNKIDSIQDISDFSTSMNQLLQEGVTLPISVKVDTDENTPTLRALYFYGGAPVLLTKANDINDVQTQSRDTIAGFLTGAGVPIENVENIIENTIKFDQILLDNQSSADVDTDLYQNGYTGQGIKRINNYLPVNYVNFSNLSAYVDLDKFVNQTVGMTPGYVYEMTPSFYNNLDKIISPDNFKYMKSWMISNYVLNNSSYIYQLLGNFPAVQDETNEEFNARFGYYLTETVFANEFSKYFGDVLLSKESKSAVQDMAENIVSAYKTELSNSSWLSTSTKQEALNKLSNMTINIGYQPTSYSYMDKLNVSSTGNFLEKFQEVRNAHGYEPFLNYQKPVDHTQWGDLSSLETNAQYAPTSNAIYIGTGIIQSPFFSVSQTDSQNYGGLGTIIGHELSHAFDGTGSLYNGDGLFQNWWTASDLETYNQKYNQMIQDYDGINFQGAVLKGSNVVDEALADNAGLKVDQLALQQKGGANWKQFFEQYAKANQHKYFLDPDNSVNKSNAIATLEKDVHAPFPVRIDVNLQNNDIFDKTYNVKPGDGMYIAPENRFDLWS